MNKTNEIKKLTSTFSKDNSQEEIHEEIFINNAGLVLCNPFLPQLFARLSLTTESGFIDEKSSERGVLLLQSMLFENTTFPEHLIVLNKLICGIEPGISINQNIEISSQEKETMQQMLTVMIQHWSKLGNTSIKGLIESFLIRDGKLNNNDDHWLLSIEHKAYDILLGSIPWSYSPIKYNWMKKPIYVKWID